MQHGYVVSEVRREGAQHLRRERDLRYQQYAAATLGALLRYEPDVYGRLSGAGHAEQQRSSGLFAVGQGGYALIGGALALVKLGQGGGFNVHLRAAKDLLVGEADEPRVHKRVQALPGRAGEFKQLRDGGSSY